MVDRGIFGDDQGNPFRPLLPIREGSRILDTRFVPGEWDVICHASKGAQDHVGNRRFELCVENHIEAYKKAKSRIEKSAVISDIVGSIRESSTTGGGFVRYDMRIERWYEVGDKVARDKVGQSLRAHSSNNKKTLSSLFAQNSSHNPPPFPLQSAAVPIPSSSEPFPPQIFASTQIVMDQKSRPYQTINNDVQGYKGKSNDSGRDSPSNSSLMAWFEADSRGTRRKRDPEV